MEKPVLHGLPAQVGAQCRVLILGSMPGMRSLAQAQYYAHPRNRFWPLMADLLRFDVASAYPQRLQALKDRGVGLWDVIGRCTRPGSLDAAIDPRSIVANDLPGLMRQRPGLAMVACNGGAAFQAWRRYVAPQLAPATTPPVLALPSTSPANAAWPLARLLAAWRVLDPYLAAVD